MCLTPQAIHNVTRCMRAGGDRPARLLFRDYARGDMAQVAVG